MTMTDDRSRFGGFLGTLLARMTGEPKYPASERIYTGRTPAGITVNADTALKNATVWACVRYLSQGMGALPWHVMRANTTDGGGQRIVTSPVAKLLNTRPNDEWSAFQFRETLTAWALLQGNGYAEIERDGAARPIALWPMHPERVTPSRDESGTLFYRVDNGSEKTTELDAADVFHIRGFGDGPVGANVIQYAAESVGWAQATEIFGAAFFGNGLNPAGVVEVGGSLSPEGEEMMRRKLNSLHRGPRNSNKWAILDAGSTFKPFSVQPDHAQFIETRQHQIEEIARWFGVPPHKVGHLLRATFSNIEHQAIEVVVDSITPWAIRWEQEADFKLFGAGQRLYTKLNLNGLMRGDAKSRGEFYKLMREIGAMSANDVRRLEDQNPIGPDGDKYVMQSQYTTLERIGEEPEPVAPPPPDDDDTPGTDAEIEAGVRLAGIMERMDNAA